jgi:hypothetical protein
VISIFHIMLIQTTELELFLVETQMIQSIGRVIHDDIRCLFRVSYAFVSFLSHGGDSVLLFKVLFRVKYLLLNLRSDRFRVGRQALKLCSCTTWKAQSENKNHKDERCSKKKEIRPSVIGELTIVYHIADSLRYCVTRLAHIFLFVNIKQLIVKYLSVSQLPEHKRQRSKCHKTNSV